MAFIPDAKKIIIKRIWFIPVFSVFKSVATPCLYVPKFAELEVNTTKAEEWNWRSRVSLQFF